MSRFRCYSFMVMGDRDGQDLTRTSATGSGPSGEASSDAERLHSGALVAERYRIVSFLGRGGMGEVYRADDLTLGQSVALKFLPDRLATNPELIERFRREVRIGREITHPNVCRIYDIGESDGRIFLSMEYVDGEDLASLLVRIDRLGNEKAVEIARQLCAGLAAAHDRGILHRDLKPANVMLDGRGKVRITDFGIAALAESATSKGREGTPAYMAPEQLRGKPSTVQTDLYSLGLVLYELFTGRRAFEAKTVPELMELQASSTLSDPSELVTGMDSAMEQLILRCLDPDPEQRPLSAIAVAMSLPGSASFSDALAAGEIPSPQMVAALQSSTRASPLVTCLLAAGVIAAVGAFIAISAPLALTSKAPLDKPPVALVDRAQDMLKRIGVDDEPVDQAWGYGNSSNYGAWIVENDPGEDRWRRAADARPAFTFFWYRQAPDSFRIASYQFDRGIVGPSSPRWSMPGETYISLDLAGRLRRVYVIPASKQDAPDASRAASGESDFDFGSIFALAELDIASFQPVEPTLKTQFRVDRRFAWIGVYPEDETIPMRVEAGLVDDELAYFRFLPPWEDQSRAAEDSNAESEEPPAPPSITDRLLRFLSRIAFMPFVVTMGLVFIAGWLTRRNLRAGRGDPVGAGRVGLFTAVAGALAKWFAGQNLWLRHELEFVEILAWGAFMGMGTWSAYIAIEPVVRRRWPTTLVSWTRLTRGRFRDPLVGRSILIGMLVGSLFALVHRASFLYLVTESPWLPVFYRYIQAVRHLAYVEPMVFFATALIRSFLSLLVLVGLLRLFKRQWAAALCFVPILALLNDLVGDHNYSPFITLVYAAVITFALLRSGILTLIAAEVTVALVYSPVYTTRWTAWFAHEMQVVLFVLGAMLLWGLVASLSPDSTASLASFPSPARSREASRIPG